MRWTNLNILDKVVEDAQAFRVLTFRDVHQRPNLCGLRREYIVKRVKKEAIQTCRTYLEGDMITSQSNFKLLLAYNVFLRPIRVILPEDEDALEGIQRSSWEGQEMLAART